MGMLHMRIGCLMVSSYASNNFVDGRRTTHPLRADLTGLR